MISTLVKKHQAPLNWKEAVQKKSHNANLNPNKPIILEAIKETTGFLVQVKQDQNIKYSCRVFNKSGWVALNEIRDLLEEYNWEISSMAIV